MRKRSIQSKNGLYIVWFRLKLNMLFRCGWIRYRCVVSLKIRFWYKYNKSFPKEKTARRTYIAYTISPYRHTIVWNKVYVNELVFALSQNEHFSLKDITKQTAIFLIPSTILYHHQYTILFICNVHSTHFTCIMYW